MKSEVDRILKKHQQLNQLDMARVICHSQREAGEWIVHSLILEGYEVPFRYRRKTKYKSLEGARVNLTYYPHTETVAGLDFEVMNVVRIRRS